MMLEGFHPEFEQIRKRYAKKNCWFNLLPLVLCAVYICLVWYLPMDDAALLLLIAIPIVLIAVCVLNEKRYHGATAQLGKEESEDVETEVKILRREKSLGTVVTVLIALGLCGAWLLCMLPHYISDFQVRNINAKAESMMKSAQMAVEKMQETCSEEEWRAYVEGVTTRQIVNVCGNMEDCRVLYFKGSDSYIGRNITKKTCQFKRETRSDI